MNQLIRWFAHNHIAANMLMVTTMVLGIVLLPKIHKEIFPPLERDKIHINVALPGAGPGQVEQTVCAPIELAIAPLSGISHIRSISGSNFCFIASELEFDANAADALQMIKEKVSAVSLPPAATTPSITRSLQDQMISRISIVGNVDYKDLRKAAEKAQHDLRALGLNNVTLRDAQDYQISIEVAERKLQQFKLSFAEIAVALQENSTSLGAGHIQSDNGTASIVVSGKYGSIEELGNTVVRTLPDGGQIQLKDVATIHDEFPESNMISRVNGKPALSVSVYQEENRSITETSEIINGYLDEVKGLQPEGIEVIHIQDNAAFFSNRIRLLTENALQGLALVFLSLLFFLHFRMAFWVSNGIVFAFCGAFIVLFVTGNSINMVSTFGMLLVLGILVDDGIVIAENIYTHQLNGKPGIEGAVSGTIEVAQPVIFSVLTNAVTFVPLFFLPGAMGVLMAQIPLVVIAALLFSLMEAFFCLPAHLSHNKPLPNIESPRWMLTRHIEKFVDSCYRPALAFTLKWHYAAITCFISVLLISLSLIASGWVKVDYFAAMEAEVATGHVAFPEGTEFEKTREAIDQIERAAIELREELFMEYGSDQILNIRTLAGNNANAGDVFINLATTQDRAIGGSELMARWKEKAGSFPEAMATSFNSRFELVEPGFNVRLFSSNPEQLKEATNALKLHLENYPGVYNISDSFNTAYKEVKISLKDSAKDMGLDLKIVSAQIAQSFMGAPLPAMNRNTHNAAVTLQIPSNERNTLWHLENMPISIRSGEIVPLNAVATIEYENSASSIFHLDGKRVVLISAQLDENRINGTQLYKQVEQQFISQLKQTYPDVTSKPSEMIETEQKVKERLALGFWLSILVMFVMMAIVLDSYTLPLMILTAVPFGIIGALAGHLIFGEQLTIFSLCGMVAVSGIVVNDNIVLVFYINDHLKKGGVLIEALKEAGASRFRAIFLTTITTFLGVSTLFLEGSWEAQFLIPMALSIAFGVLFATTISLFLVPSLYLALHETKCWAGGKIDALKSRLKINP